ncbi:ATP-dependent helicase [Vibrio splendidus]|uniref:ATP-dependent helicase n=1 Tax=Vibrio splendidus TaxID=29497 RepID=UPI00352FEB9D
MNSQLELSMPKKDIKEVLSSLNQNQLSAAISRATNIRVVAGPGTGKTKTMEARVAHLLDKGVDPKSILALSFTNESSTEFKGRVQDTCGYLGHKITTGTFHAVFNRFLKKYAGHEFFKTKLGYPDGFFIIDDDDSKKLMKEAISSLPKGYKKLIDRLELKPKDFSSQMSILRAKCHTPSTFARVIMKDKTLHSNWVDVSSILNASDSSDSVDAAAQAISKDYRLRDFLLTKVWNEYTLRCRKANAIDFDDVLTNTYYLMRHNPSICKKIASEFSHVLVDEYQDTNYIQAAILKEMKKGNPLLNLFLVGDGRQAIYDFRGSDVLLMTNAQNDFGDFEDHELNINYRSSENLISFTNIFASDMENQLTKGQLLCGVDSIPNSPSEYHQFKSDRDEAKWVVDEINRQISNGEKPEDIYVIYRTRTAAKGVEEELRKNHVRFEMVGERNFYERAEVRDAMAYMRSIVRPKDILAWSRIVDVMPVSIRGMWLRDKYQQEQENTPIEILKGRAKGKLKESVEGLLDFHKMSYDLLRADDNALMADFIAEDGASVNLEQAKRMIETVPEAKEAYDNWRHDFWSEVCESLRDQYVAEVLPAYEKIDSNKKKVMGQENVSPTEERVERIGLVFDELRVRLTAGQSLFDIVDDLLTRDTKQRDKTTEGVKLLTGHASKGLEAKTCFIVGCDTAIWKKGADPLTDKEIDEASRLYYVMSTRAKEKNYITSAASRFMFDRTVRSAPFQLIADHIQRGIALNQVTYHEHGNSMFNSQNNNTNSLPVSAATERLTTEQSANGSKTRLGSRLKASFARLDKQNQSESNGMVR